MEGDKCREDKWKVLMERLHEETAPLGTVDPHARIPEVFKKLLTEKIPLPKDFGKSEMIVEDAITQRTSRRNFLGKMSVREVSKVLFYLKGFKRLEANERGIFQKANVPSAGSRHPLEAYTFLQNVEGLADGIYHYDIEGHALEKMVEGHHTKEKFAEALKEEKGLAQANMVLFLTAIHQRTSFKYGPRSYRLIHLDAGHVGQNAYLIAEAMGLSCCPIGKWDDGSVNDLLRIDGKREFVVYCIAMGKRDEGQEHESGADN